MDEDGRLVVFELKRGQMTRDAVAQAIDYASFLADLETDELCRHIETHAGRGGTEKIEDFSKWYQNQYQRPVADIGTPRVVLVGLGADERTKRMIAFLAKCDLDISLITFHGFRQGQQTLLARQVEVQARSGSATVRWTKQDNQAKFGQLLESLGLRSNYDSLMESLTAGLGPDVYRWPNINGYSFSLQEVSESGESKSRSFMALYANDKRRTQLQVFLQRRAVEVVGEEPLQRFASMVGAKAEIKRNGSAEIWISAVSPLSEQEVMLKLLGEELLRCLRKRNLTSSQRPRET
jgi:hypothetical protein